ncbi:aspartate 1-decarboxylase [Desulfuromonas versatilis]|uniref:Aspartate 1-decarboxylase n=1 Tax=Desulfuromonas versatilis TaxID=2802975 RepID=A0ABN6DZ28_9BACT|nr:aspartate 1-decarboxylase [Desulfuromonas versatilis]BCR05325.1 aspartate 1-decarboxylase [Desulfuromonas versatilis]
MTRKMLKSKIHRATVTGADLHYEGSITIDPLLMEAADIYENEAVDIWNVTYGTRFQTYAIAGQPGSGTICINGAAARLVSKTDLVIIASWQEMSAEEARGHKPKLVFVNEKNEQVDLERKQENPGQGQLKKAI